MLINCLDDGYVVENESRVDKENRWESIKKEILDAYLNNNFQENRATKKGDLSMMINFYLKLIALIELLILMIEFLQDTLENVCHQKFCVEKCQ
ncbi:hypothetical protein [Helicobacter sp. MIT 14-3879]|uniref:hypothetical protein n=1 Tax=Helicobacter sp. MIT 14-3879 TaxID=2040649 RepID=UPI000E36CF4B|nr:hypothetical protein [Helicobacter sp. MIT 14-3879]RDU65154.1 hypothetical protein CQA44_02240 [Helicobacter sp. MIT 14-3879]